MQSEYHIDAESGTVADLEIWREKEREKAIIRGTVLSVFLKLDIGLATL